MKTFKDVYLDIETTGLSWEKSAITVVGCYLVSRGRVQLVQLVGKDVTRHNLIEALGDVGHLYTYNGSRFDLPFIHNAIGIDLEEITEHHDLMYHCWQCNLWGGFKAVERQLGIPRRLTDISGWDAVRLWEQYQQGDDVALQTLLEYNKEDVVNLKILRDRLAELW